MLRFCANVCMLEVKSSSAVLPRPYMSSQLLCGTRPQYPSSQSRGGTRPQSAAHLRRSDPYIGPGREPLFPGKPLPSRCISSTSTDHQRSSDAVASGLAYLRGSAEQPMRTFGMFGSEKCLVR